MGILWSPGKGRELWQQGVGDGAWGERAPYPLEWGESARKGFSLWPQHPSRTVGDVSVVCEEKQHRQGGEIKCVEILCLGNSQQIELQQGTSFSLYFFRESVCLT